MPIFTENNRIEKGLSFKPTNREQRRSAGILSAAGREEEYQDRQKIMKASVSWNKYVPYGTMSILRDFMGLNCMVKSYNII